MLTVPDSPCSLGGKCYGCISHTQTTTLMLLSWKSWWERVHATISMTGANFSKTQHTDDTPPSDACLLRAYPQVVNVHTPSHSYWSAVADTCAVTQQLCVVVAAAAVPLLLRSGALGVGTLLAADAVLLATGEGACHEQASQLMRGCANLCQPGTEPANMDPCWLHNCHHVWLLVPPPRHMLLHPSLLLMAAAQSSG